MMSQWLYLDEDVLKKVPSSQQEIRGVHIQVFMSPFDMPQAVRGYYDRTLSRFVIEFKYVGGDERTDKKEENGLTLRMGRRTRRLYGIEVDVHSIGVQGVVLELLERIERALHGLEMAAPFPSRQNYRAATQALEVTKDRLVSQMAQ